MTHNPQRRQGVKADSLPAFPLELVESLLSIQFDLSVSLRAIKEKHPHGLPEHSAKSLRSDFIESRAEEILGVVFPGFFDGEINHFSAVRSIGFDSLFMVMRLLGSPDPRIREQGLRAADGILDSLFSLLGILVVLKRDEDLSESRSRIGERTPLVMKLIENGMTMNPQLAEELLSEAGSFSDWLAHFVEEVDL